MLVRSRSHHPTLKRSTCTLLSKEVVFTNLTNTTSCVTEEVRKRADGAVLFVRVIRAVRTSITPVMFVYARARPARELVLRAMRRDTVRLISPVTTVPLSVTSQKVRETGVVARYLVLLAACTVHLVLAERTLSDSVTLVAWVYTLSCVTACIAFFTFVTEEFVTAVLALGNTVTSVEKLN